MAVVSWTDSSVVGTSYVSTAGTANISVTGSSVKISNYLPTVQVKHNFPSGAGVSKIKNYQLYGYVRYPYYSSTSSFAFNSKANTTSVNNNTYVTLAWNASNDINTAWCFSTRNPSSRTVTVTQTVYMVDFSAYSSSAGWEDLSSMPSSEKTINTFTLTLNVPPIATVSQVSFDTPYVYAGMTTASVTVTDATAYYGGTVSSVTLTIGGQSASISGDGTLSILLNAGGTFTPIVTITDSRGQTKDYPLDPITVNTYATPTVNFDAERTDVNGKIADEGEYATIVTTLTFDPIAEAVAPTVAVADEDGITQTATTTWYSSRASDGTLSGAVTWSTLASGSTVYGLISITGDFDTQKSYVISLTPQDSEGITGDVKTDTLQTAFYTVDFLAGGHGIAFGQPASQTGFFCNMPANFVDANDVMRALFDFVYPVGSYYETSDTTFDPNVTWGGTWSLETEGQVHISAGANYTVAGALTDTTDGGSKDAVVVAHTHTIANDEDYFLTINYGTTAVGAGETQVATGSSGRYALTCTKSTVDFKAIQRTQTTGASGTDNNMQPYIIVNRWHRTA